MNERPAPVEEDARRWACAELGVAEDAPAEAIRAAFLKHVGESEFFPTPDHVVAWQTLAGAPFIHSPPGGANPAAAGAAKIPPVAAARIARQRAQAQSRKAVEEFADRFFSIDVGARARRWFELRGQCQSNPGLVARLEALSAGLHIDLAAEFDSTPAGAPADPQALHPQAPDERMVAERICEMFTLRPLDRSERQQEILLSWQQDLALWQSATRKLNKTYPRIAALDPEFVSIVVDPPKTSRRRRTPVKYPSSQAKSPPAAAKSGSTWGWTIGVFVSLMCISAVSRCAREGNQWRSPQAEQRQREDAQRQQRMFDEQKMRLKLLQPMDVEKDRMPPDGLPTRDYAREAVKRMQSDSTLKKDLERHQRLIDGYRKLQGPRPISPGKSPTQKSLDRSETELHERNLDP